MSTFSERMGYIKPPEFMQIDDMNHVLKNRLMNFCETYLLQPLERLERKQLKDIENLLLDKLKKNYSNALFLNDQGYMRAGIFRDKFMKMHCYERYTFIEELIQSLIEHFYSTTYNPRKFFDGTPKSFADQYLLGKFIKDTINEILETENSGYHLTDALEFIKITSEAELKEVEQTQKCSIESVRDRFNHAVSLFSDREKPEYANAVKEALSAMEILAQYYTGNPKGTLGKLIMDSSIDLPPALKQSISSLYGYASNEGNARHGNLETEHEVTFNEAKFIIVTTSALINYIIALNPKKKELEK